MATDRMRDVRHPAGREADGVSGRVVKVNFRPVPERVSETAIVYITPSQSEEFVTHYTIVTDISDDEGIVCTCKGYQFNGHCWHEAHARKEGI